MRGMEDEKKEGKTKKARTTNNKKYPDIKNEIMQPHMDGNTLAHAAE